jgi:predicted DCC family thiol-disulfide oxidoreductase YuxK
VLRWTSTLHKHGFEIAPLQDPWVRSRLGLTERELLQNVRLLLPNGTQLAGADVYRHIFRRVPWTYPVAVLASAPILRRVCDWTYRRIAENRHRMSRACRL